MYKANQKLFYHFDLMEHNRVKRLISDHRTYVTDSLYPSNFYCMLWKCECQRLCAINLFAPTNPERHWSFSKNKLTRQKKCQNINTLMTLLAD